ncbi:MAG: LuxR C-terminal-related transcriptional regulator [Anaerolineae bacterium]|nr:LuxR C-terminal-related transcriptional regulator [Candidatus Roseilinea sp.]MDW8449895.1 LuxR C-terminal-related transcriptional regulator [Anaerolineae bacterium]
MGTDPPVQPTLLLTKLYKPRVSTAWIERPRLLHALDAGLARKLILVDAPAGYGKTTLLAQWLHARPLPSAWLSLDEADDDLVTFLSYVALAARTVYADSMSSTAMLPSAAQLPSLDELTNTFINELDALPGELILVLDDFHLIRSPEIARLMARVAMHPPPTLHLVLATRSDPALPLARMRAADELLEIRAADLRFTSGEARAFISSTLQQPLSEELVHALEDQTEGWPAGLRLALLSLTVAGAPHLRSLQRGAHITDYLTNEVFERLPPTAQDFLLRAALPDQFCAALCDALRMCDLTGVNGDASDSRALLEEIKRRNLFVISLNGDDEWLRFHPLFHNFLRDKLQSRSSAEAIARLHKCASDWLAAHGFLEEALQHAQAAGDMGRLARLIEDNVHTLLNREEIITLERWLGLVPDTILQRRPRLLPAHAYLKIVRQETADIALLADQAERLLQENAADLTDEERTAAMGDVWTVRARAALDAGKGPACVQLAEKAFRLVPEAHHYARGTALTPLALGLYMAGRAAEAASLLRQEAVRPRTPSSFTLRILHNQWIAALLAGEVARANAIAERHVAAAEAIGLMVTVGWGHTMAGLTRYVLNDLDRAIEHLEVATVYGQRAGFRCRLYAQTQLALAYEATGRPDAADAALDALRELARPMQSVEVHSRIDSTSARLRLLRGDVDGAMRWVRSSFPLRNPATLLFNDVPDLTRAQILIAQRSPEALAEATALVHELRSAAEAWHLTYQLARILAVQASLLYAQHCCDKALQVMANAMRIGQQGRIIGTLADLGPDVRAVVQLLTTRAAPYDLQESYLHSVLNAFHGPSVSISRTNGRSARAYSAGLTQREVEVLELLNKRRTDKEIAEALVISRLTVSKHTANIYRKLGVAGRREAVAKARHMGILSD